MAKFKVGDRVKFTEHYAQFNGDMSGTVVSLTVPKSSVDPDGRIVVLFDGQPETWCPKTFCLILLSKLEKAMQ